MPFLRNVVGAFLVGITVGTLSPTSAQSCHSSLYWHNGHVVGPMGCSNGSCVGSPGCQPAPRGTDYIITTCKCNGQPDGCCHLVWGHDPDTGDDVEYSEGNCSAQDENCQTGTSCVEAWMLWGEDWLEVPMCLPQQ